MMSPKTLRHIKHSSINNVFPVAIRRKRRSPIYARAFSVPPIRDQDSPNRKIFEQPIFPIQALSNYSYLLTEEDKDDISNFQSIYFLSRTDSVLVENHNSDHFQFTQGSHIAFRYEQLEFAGSGTFGSVIKCFDFKTKTNVAIKMISLNKTEHSQIQLEIEYLERLSEAGNPQESHVIEIIDKFEFRGFLCLVMTNLESDLYKGIQSRNFYGYQTYYVKRYGVQIAEALQFIHHAGIVHSDLKPENIMFTNANQNDITVIDFGCSCNINKPLYTVVQSLYYRAPEVIFGFKYSKEIDIWSFGCVLFEIATGVPLFHCRDEEGLIKAIYNLLGLPPQEMVERSKKMRKYFQPGIMANRAAANAQKRELLAKELVDFDPLLTDLICGCLEWLPSKRLTIEEILNHPFFD